jgi:hypothetical protein
MPRDFGKKLRLKLGDIMPRVRDDLRVTVWKDKQNINMLTNMHHPPAEGNFCDEHGNTLKAAIIQGYNRHMGHVDKTDHITNCYPISRHKWK